MLGVNRHGTPVVIRPFRAEPTRAVLIGGLRCAEMLTLRALALGAHVTVQSTRPDAWSPFLRPRRRADHLLPAGRPPTGPAPTATARSSWSSTPARRPPHPRRHRGPGAATLLAARPTAADADLLIRVTSYSSSP